MRHLTTLALAGLFGGLLLTSDASACHKKKCPCPTPAPVCAPVVYAPAPVVCAPKKTCHMKMPKMPKMSLCHKKATCAPVYTTATYAPAPMATPQASGQGSMQSM